MRRLLISTLACGALATPAAASPAPPGTARLDPSAAGAGAHLLLDAEGSEGGGFHRREIPTGLAISLERGFAVDPAAAAGVCTDQQARDDRCPPNSILGTGLLDVLGEGFAFGPGGQKFTAQLTFYRAEPRQAGDPAGVVFSFKELSSGYRGASIGRLIGAAEPLGGPEVRWDSLPIPDLPPGLEFTIQRIRINLGAGAATPPVRVRKPPRKAKKRRYHRCHRVTRRTRSGRRHRVLVCHPRHRHRRPPRRARAAQAGGVAFLTNPGTCAGSWRVRLELVYPSATEQRDADAPCTTAR